MKIINHGKKDYYDYLSGFWGEDPLIVYDRSNPIMLDSMNYSGKWYEDYFYSKPLWDDVKRTHPDSEYASKSYLFSTDSWYAIPRNKRKEEFKNYKEGKILHLAIEVGKNIYNLEIDRYIDDENPNVVHIEPRLIKKIVADEKRSDAPVSMYPCTMNRFRKLHHMVSEDNLRQKIDNPVLIKTWVPKIIPAEDMWKELYEYLGSLKDKPITDSRTNDEHIESNGFDKRVSFRNIK